ncbi:MAG TPA: hypothetical protein DEP92_03625 [Candidatus Komeilibacteria bacterium]|nr:MAG: hypothetical protein UW91_C0025G0001 [Parcubacteria group bacterium GW2011_GWF2_45_11]KKT98847.1 MAG: hypothetical protein UW98_C0001G0023 [Parcubacteria group bacterium GW2011_GWC2_45_15]OGY93245.1 MAG: hypothetical protein A2260_01410 [Candidatus Komeilibacteria bacterium RIFOXYA2_FULL_45_9]OGY96148.1 MAG: hypothetical protein A3J95_03610 [Candidatus Komeilibacteria bacterium RIFOXYC2_FULL_45_12]HCC73869.1 hypothetical protein [Candidatus Komeilibacteria bacterium]
MSRLIWASALITIALVWYTAGLVLSLKKKRPHSFWCFFIGWLAFDLPGTILMYLIAGKITLNCHTVPGMIGFVLMAIAAGLALKQILNFKEPLMKLFTPIEAIGYIIRLCSYLVGIAIRI